jgi:peptidoglycan biosynthesis protein MviN/MurJ (putative lipid II flippase)
MLAANVALNFTLVAVLGLDIGGLALATALTSWGNLMLLLPGLERRLGLPPADRTMVGRLGTIALAATGSCLAARGLYAVLAPEAHSAIALALAIASAGALYGLSAHWLGIPEWRHMTSRFRRQRPPPP